MQYYRGSNSQYSRISRRNRGGKRFPQFSTFFLASSVLKFALIALILGILGTIGFVLWISRDLPTPGKLANSDMQNSTKILDRNGEVLYSIFKDYNRIYVPLDDIPKNLRNATIATEDKDFYQNKGFSVWAYFRVAKDIILHQRVTGGSTITQQLVKNALLTSDRKLTRKMKELILAVQVDKRYSKDEVLEMYLNNVPFGGTAVGVEAAANLYFDKPAKDLDLAQSAFLAGLPQSPSYYSPFSGNGKAYIERTRQVLGRMEDEHYITKEEGDKALKEVEKFKFTQVDTTLKAPHFVMYVKDKLAKQFGEAAVENGNLTVTTTLDYSIQKQAEKIVKEEIGKLKDYDVSNGAAVVLDPKTGAILAMVGSADYFDDKNDGNFNAAVQGVRQPGSSLKPIMYATAFEKGYTPATLLMDTKTEFPGGEGQEPYKPVNYDGKYRGPVQVRFALGNSLNIPAVKMLALVGIKPVMQQAYNMGIKSWEPTPDNINKVGLSLVLGGRETTLLEITDAYAVFADQGKKHDAFSILEVKNSKGKVLFKKDKDDGDKVLSPESAFLISHILYDNNARKDAFGPSSYLNIPGHTVAVKTGTTDEKRDNWTIGYTPSYVVGVWVGNNDNTKMNPKIASGITGASPIWNKIMTAILKGKKDEEFPVPDKVIAAQVDPIGGVILPTRSMNRRCASASSSGSSTSSDVH
jgi:1A family penicillin-binding protein